MSDFDFKGMGVALITPFDIDGSVDYNSLAVLSERLVASGADYIVVMGTTAETPTLRPEEKIKIRDIISETVGGMIPLVLGFGGNCTRTLCSELKDWDGEGYDAVLSVTPFYNKPSQQGMYEHFKMVAEASPVPVLLYNVPGRTGVNMLPETTLKLAQIPGIVGIKEASGNLSQVEKILAAAPSDFAVISGDDQITVEMVQRGARGVISVIGNATPSLWRNLTHYALNGDFGKALEIENSLQPLLSMLFEQGNPAGIKALMAAMALCEETLRLPLVAVEDNLRDRIKIFADNHPELC